MALLKFLRRSDSSADPTTPAATSAAAEAVRLARQQARRRLVGAVVLLGIGIIGFPLVFQTQPRPIPVDIPIDIPRKDGAPPLSAALEGADAARPAGAAKSAGLPAPPAPPAPAPAPAAKASAAGVPVEVEVVPPAASEPKASVKVDAKTEAQQDSKDRGRFVVQAGSYTDLDAVRDVRAKLERLGLKTYTQAAVIEGVTRVRVRVGPFNSRQEALEVQNKIKAAGVAASLLQL